MPFFECSMYLRISTPRIQNNPSWWAASGQHAPRKIKSSERWTSTTKNRPALSNQRLAHFVKKTIMNLSLLALPKERKHVKVPRHVSPPEWLKLWSHIWLSVSCRNPNYPPHIFSIVKYIRSLPWVSFTRVASWIRARASRINTLVNIWNSSAHRFDLIDSKKPRYRRAPSCSFKQWPQVLSRNFNTIFLQ